jgi:thymidine phosphorylase
MDRPLGRAIGNAIEVIESVEVLAGGGPSDVVELTVTLAREMLAAAGLSAAKDPADALKDGSAMDVWRRMISAQGGNPDATLQVAKESHEIRAPETGVLTRLDALGVGVAAWRLGAGRARKEDPVSFGAGIIAHAKPGDQVTKGEPLLTLYADDAARFDRALQSLDGAIEIASSTPGASGATPAETPDLLPLIIDRIT